MKGKRNAQMIQLEKDAMAMARGSSADGAGAGHGSASINFRGDIIAVIIELDIYGGRQIEWRINGTPVTAVSVRNYLNEYPEAS